MRTLFPLLALLCGCPTPVTSVDLEDVGSACISDGEVLVDFNQCLSSSCDTLVDAQCTAVLDGTTLTVTATATIESEAGDCTADCGFATVSCDLPAGADAATEIVYGEATTAIDAACETL